MSSDDDDNNSDDDEETPRCDWCDRKAKRRSLIMGYYEGCQESMRWGKGDLICSGKCLKSVKTKLYAVRYSGRQIFATKPYYNKYWKNDPKAKVLKTPQDHKDQLQEQQQQQQQNKRKKNSRKRGEDHQEEEVKKRQKAT